MLVSTEAFSYAHAYVAGTLLTRYVTLYRMGATRQGKLGLKL